MELQKNLKNDKESGKSLLLQTVKNLSSNLTLLKNSLLNLFTPNDDRMIQEMEKLCEIHTKETIIMNQIRLGMEKDHSNSQKSEKKREKTNITENPMLKQLEQLFNQQSSLEKDRTKHLTNISNSLQELFRNVQTKISQQIPKNNFQTQLQQLIEQLKLDKNSNFLQRWTGNLYVNTIFGCYKQHIQGDVSFDDTKMQMSFTILSAYQKFVLRLYKQGFDNSTIQEIEERLQKQASKAITYLITKCPMSKQTIDVTIFQKLDARVDESKHPQYDFLHILNIQFDPNALSIGPELKKFISGIIQEVNNFYPSFKQFIHELMDGVEKVDTKGGFTFGIQRKIMQGVQKYSDQEISTPGFFTKSNELMRTITKWVEYLILPFKNPTGFFNQYYIFRTSEGYQRLNHKEREYMAQKFQKKSQKLEDILKSLNLFLERTLSSIISISDNPIGSVRIQSFPFLDNLTSSLLLASRYIWKTIQGFANEIIRQILKLYDEIKDEYYKENRRQAEFQLYGFYVEDLISCECQGSKDAVLCVYNNLLSKQEQKEIKILQVSNNLQKPSQNIIIIFKHKNSFLLCELSLKLTGKKGQQKDQFNRFLRQIQKTILCPTFMLASSFINLNPVKQYLKKYKPYFKPNSKRFMYCGQSNRIVCQNHPEVILKDGVIYNSFICNCCFLFIQSYLHYFTKKYCTKCYLNICAVCQLQMLPLDQAYQYLLSPVQRVLDYFTPIQLYIHQDANDIKQKLTNRLRENQDDYLLVVGYKNGSNKIQMTILKSLIHHNQELILTNFQNQIYNFKKLQQSLVLILKPSYPLCLQSADVEYEDLYSLQENYRQIEGEHYIEVENKSKDCRVIIDYQIKKPSAIRQLISKTAITRLIKNQNTLRQGKLSFDKLIIDFALFKNIQAPKQILVIDINQCQLNSETNLDQMNIFTNLQQIFVSNSPSFSYKQFSFRQSIVSINITQCQLANFEFNFPKLKQLRLIKNKLVANFQIKFLPKVHTLKLCQNQINSFWNLQTCNLPSVIKLDLKCNNIAQALPTLKFKKLRVLQLSQNQIKDISNISKCELPNLKHLYLNYNQIQVLPSFSNLDHLQVLKLSNNKIREIEGLQHDNLQVLDLSNNNLVQVPQLTFNSLVFLSLKRNKISNFQTLKTSDLQSLQQLQVQFNPILEGKLPLLKHLDSIKVPANLLNININPLQVCSTKQELVCKKCSKEIKQFVYFQNQNECICGKCYSKIENKDQFGQVLRLDSDLISKYS